MTASVLAVARPELPAGCGAAKYDRGPYCGATPVRPFIVGLRCARHVPVNSKTGVPVPFLRAVKELS